MLIKVFNVSKMVKSLQFIAVTLVSVNFYCKGFRVAAKSYSEPVELSHEESSFALCVTLRYLSVFCGLREKISFFYKTSGFLIHNGLVILK